MLMETLNKSYEPAANPHDYVGVFSKLTLVQRFLNRVWSGTPLLVGITFSIVVVLAPFRATITSIVLG